MKSGWFLLCSVFCVLISDSVETTTIRVKRKARDLGTGTEVPQLDTTRPVFHPKHTFKDIPHEFTENDLDHEKFMIPKTLKPVDSIEVQGNVTLDRRWITVSLVMHNSSMDSPDFENVACRIRVKFPETHSTDNDVTIHAVVDGEHQTPKSADITVSDAFQGGTGIQFDFTIVFVILETNNIELSLNGVTSLENCVLHESHDLNDIRYLTLGGHIHKVDEISFVLA